MEATEVNVLSAGDQAEEHAIAAATQRPKPEKSKVTMKANVANVLLIGHGAREHTIAEAIKKSRHETRLFAWMKMRNPGIAALADGGVKIGDRYSEIAAFAKEREIDLVIIGPEEPLYRAVVDSLVMYNIPTVGPLQSSARIETSKAFARELMERYQIPGLPKFRVFQNLGGIRRYLDGNLRVALKPDGLTGGKGVKVYGEHFTTVDAAMAICVEILRTHEAVVIEEKLLGEEFSLQCFCDGEHISAMPPVQDHKRRLLGDQGLNTGSMGSYSCADHLLPFLAPDELKQAVEIVRRVVEALSQQTGELYKGIIYGGFMLTADSVKLLEFNARFGDPEAINVLPLLETDFMDILWAMASGTLDEISIKFKPWATVVKYLVPVNYGMSKEQLVETKSDLVQIGDIGEAALYYSSVNQDATGCHLTSSRAVAVLGMSPDLAQAERIAEQAACNITGDVAHRPDIGTAALIAKRIRHMEELRGKQ